MANKKFLIQQKVTKNGVPSFVNATVYAATVADLAGLTALLEGEYSILEETSKGGTSANVTAYDYLSRVSAKAEDTLAGYASIFPSGTGFVIKNGKNTDELSAAFATLNMFPDHPTKVPAVGSVKVITKNGAK